MTKSTIATVTDVKRILRKVDADIDYYVEPKLLEAEEWLKQELGIRFGETGDMTVSYPDVRNDALVQLPDSAPTIVSVVGDGVTLDATQYELYADGLLYLVLPKYAIDAIGAYVANRAFTFRKLSVTFTPSTAINALLREAAATLAAARYRQEEQQNGGVLTSERLGDYSYTLNTQFNGVPPEVIRMLRPLRRSGIRSV